MIFSAYRKGDFADPGAFAEQLYLVLKQYPKGVVTAVSDPRNSFSVQMTCKHPPTINEIAEICDREAEKQHKLAEAAMKPRFDRNRYYIPPPNHPGCRCNVFIHADAPQYPALWEWSQSPDEDARDWKLDEKGRAGVWVALSILQTIGMIRQRSSTWKSPSEGELRASLARLAGQKPAIEVEAGQ